MRRTLRLLFCSLIAAASACDNGKTRVCFGSDEFCDDAFGRNRAPEARISAPDEVFEGAIVRLDGTASFDPDGRITSYSWTQEAGPPVALAGSSEAVAEFVAPEVFDETFFELRLVVTDDDRASDAERVRVFVVPLAVRALEAGSARLKTLERPAPDPGSACVRCWSALGLWLAARTRAAAAGADDDVTVLLDELRIIELLEAPAAPAATLPDPHRQLFELGQQAVAAFTEQRDPATAELARSLAGEVPHAADTAWRDVLTAAYPGLDWIADADPRALARYLLDGGPEPKSPESIAAAMLALTAGDPVTVEP